MRHEEVLLKVPSSPEYVSVVRRAVESIAHRMRFSHSDICDIKLAVGEACNNAVRHGLNDGCCVRIRCKILPTDLCVEVTNHYEGAEPSFPIGNRPEPHEYHEGGMGVFLMKSLVDSVKFRWGKNTATVSLRKSLQTAG